MKLKTVVIILIIILVLASGSIVAFIKRKTRRLASKLMGGITMSDLKYAINSSKEAENNPDPRTVFGATSIYLPKILKDHPDYDNNEVISAIRVFFKEYFMVKYREADDFTESNVDRLIVNMINRSDLPKGVSEVVVHNTAISMYSKSTESATVTYQVAVGYRLDGKPVEERYKLEYSMKLKYDTEEKVSLICDRCGGPIESLAVRVCPYCGTGIAKTTRFAWKFRSVELS